MAPENPEVYTQSIESSWQKFKEANRRRFGTQRGDLFMLFLVEIMWQKKFGGNESLYNFWNHVSETYYSVNGEIYVREDCFADWNFDVFEE